jgi:hypothetical protein
MYAVYRDSPCAGSGGGGPEAPRGEHEMEVLESLTGVRVSLDGDLYAWPGNFSRVVVLVRPVGLDIGAGNNPVGLDVVQPAWSA